MWKQLEPIQRSSSIFRRLSTRSGIKDYFTKLKTVFKLIFMPSQGLIYHTELLELNIEK